MGDADDWVDAINRDRLQSHATSFTSEPLRMITPPVQTAQGSRFCGLCGAPAQ